MRSLLARLGVKLAVPLLFSPPATSRVARKRARLVVVCGIAGFLVATLALAVVLETAKPEWRDPEYGRRLRQLQKWQRKAPNRPLVLFLGSSRIQMGISPAAMNLPDGPTDPLVYNFGMIGAHPRWFLLNLLRLRDAGIKPKGVVIELWPRYLSKPQSVEPELSRWAERLTLRDLEQIAPYAQDLSPVRRLWVESRLNAWPIFRLRLLTAWAPDWVPSLAREDAGGDRLDPYGFLPHPANSFSLEHLARARVDYFGKRQRLDRVTEGADRAIRDLIVLSRADGAEVAFVIPPESPAFCSSYAPGERAVARKYGRQISSEEGVSIFPAPEHFREDEFVDGHHLLRTTAEKYSRWLADTHLRPWLARQRR